MKTAILLMLFSVTALAGSKQPWYDRVRELSDESSPNHKKILSEMHADKTLEPQICSAIKERKYQTEAFQAVIQLHLQSCWDDVLHSADEEHEWLAVIAAEELNKEKPRPDWPKWLKETVTGAMWASIESPNKLAILSASNQEKIQFTPAQLKTLLKDEDSDVRESVLQFVFRNLETNGGDSESRDILRRSLAQDPLQFRLAAFQIVGRLPSSIRSRYTGEIDRCVKSEAETRVKDVCEKLQSLH